MALKTGLENKPWYVGLGIGLGAGLLFFGVGYWQFVKPKQEEFAGLESQLAELQTKIQEGRTAQKELPKFREEVRQLELELDKLLRILPARRNTPDLMRRIRALAEQGDFTLKSFNPAQQLTDKDFYSEWPITINLEGGYHNLALFFDRVSRFSRIVNIEKLQISALPTSKTGHTIGSNFIAKTFVYKEPEPPAPDANQAGAGNGGNPPAGTNGGPAAKVTPGGGGND